MSLFERVHMPSFSGATEWLNSEPLGPAELQGHVVLVNFWTWTCINWLRQEPYVRAWSQAYRDDGLIVVGVHTPEFSFEHEIGNNAWPALYFVDADGRIRDRHLGEGRYEKSERILQKLLSVERHPVAVEGLGVEAPADWDNLRTPETYLGYWRTAHFASPDGAANDQRRTYERPDRLPVSHWALAGDWTIAAENAMLEHQAFLTASTSTRPETACSRTPACTNSSASTMRSASGPWRSRSSSQAPRPTRSRSGSAMPLSIRRTRMSSTRPTPLNSTWWMALGWLVLLIVVAFPFPRWWVT
jgi:thiol-disulfide isomerase/thioredoxin